MKKGEVLKGHRASKMSERNGICSSERCNADFVAPIIFDLDVVL